MHVAQAAAFCVMKIASENYDEATDSNTPLLQHFKNCSETHLVTQTVTVDTLVSLKLNHVVVMQRHGDHRISIKSSIC